MVKYMAWLKSNYLVLLLLWAAMLLIFAYSWVPGGLDVDSCNYAVVAKEVLRTNNWLGLYDPVYQGVFYYHFPLCIWITAFLFKVIGITTFAAKLFAMSCGVLLVAVVFFFAKATKNEWAGFFAAFSFLLTNHVVRLSRQCRMDIPVSLFITLAVFGIFLAQRRSRGYYLLFGLFSCLAIFAKDVFGLAPLAIASIYLALTGRWKEFFQPLFILGVLIAIGPVLLWIWADKGCLFIPWYRHNFLHLYKSTAFNVPWHYYITAIINKYFYFLPFAVYGGYLAVKEARRSRQYEFCLLLIWAIIFPLAFSFGRQKLHYFILPMYPALAILAGLAFDRIFKESVKLKIAAVLKYLLIMSSVIMLAFPLQICSKRFAETVRLSPYIDQVLKQFPRYEFSLYNQDAAAVLFYSQELKRVRVIKDIASLEEAVGAPPDYARLYYLSEQDFLRLSEQARKMCKVALKYKDKMVLLSPKEQDFVMNIPLN